MQRTTGRRRGSLLLLAILLGLIPITAQQLTHPLHVLAAAPARVMEWAEASGSSPQLATTLGGDGNVWFTNYGTNEVGRITPSGVITKWSTGGSTNPFGITAGPDGNLWFCEYGANKIAKITTSGTITTYTVPTSNSGNSLIALGSDNNLWFTEYVANKIGMVTTSGTFTEYSIGSTTNPVGITAGSDGNLWFAEETGSKVGKITTSGTITQYNAAANSTPYEITSGPDGNLWFTEEDGNKIGKLTTGGTLSEYSIPTGSSKPHGINPGPDGNVWFTEHDSNQLAEITSSGTITELNVIPTASSGPEGIVQGVDNNVWFLENATNKVARYAPSPVGGGVSAAQTRGGGTNWCIPCHGDSIRHGDLTSFPVDTMNGNFWHVFQDIQLPGRGIAAEVDRTYNSSDAGTNGAFGYGWTYNYGMSLALTGTTPNRVATITQENDSQATFNEPASGTNWKASAPRFVATLTLNGDGTWTFQRDARNTYTFNSSGQLTQQKDLNGYTTSLSYTSGNLTTVTDNASRTLTFTWTGSNITKVTDSNVSGNTRTVSYGYTSGNLTSVTDLNGGITDFQYDASHRITLMRSANFHADGALPASGPSTCTSTPTSHTVNNHYDGSGRVDCQWDPKGNKTTFAYSGDPQTAAGGATTTTDPVGNEILDTYEYGLRVQEIKGYTSSVAATTTIVYDPTTLTPSDITDANGNDTTYTHDSSGNVLTVTDPLGHVTTNTYNTCNEVLTTQDGNGVTTTNTYDANCNVLTTSRPLTNTTATATNCKSPSTAVAMAQVTCNTYGNATFPGDVTQVTDPNGKITYLHYDTNGYQDEVKDPLGHVTGTVRNNDGWITASYSAKAGCTWNSSPPTGCSATYKTAYDYTIAGSTNEFGDVGTITDPLSHTAKYTYDLDRNTLTVTDGNGNVTTSTYDANEQPCWVLPGGTSTNGCTSPPTNARVTDYNTDGTVADQKDGKGNAILTYGYNALVQVTSVTDALGNVTYYTYDLVGNVLTKKDPVAGATCTGTKVGCTTYTWDADYELKTVSYSDNPSENITSVTYDSDRQRTAMTDGTGSSSWAFDSLHRLTSYTNGNGAVVTYGYTYGAGPSYDLKSQVRTIAYPNSVGTVTQGWNDDGTLASTQDWNSKTTTFSYDANRNQTGEVAPSTTNVTDTFTFNAANQMLSATATNGVNGVSITYTRDNNGQVASDSSVPATKGNYKYTSLNQLCYGGSANTAACTSPPTGSDAYAFDNADNLTTNKGTAQQYNNADELCWSVTGTSSNACGTAPTGATTYSFDNKANRTSTVPAVGSATCYGYDQPNSLTSIKTGTGSSCTTPTTVGTYAYDGDRLRESKTVSGTTTQFTWNGVGGNLLQQYDGTTKTSWIYGPGGLPVEQIAGTTTTYLHHDQLGSTRLITDSAGSSLTATTITFDPFGNKTTTVGTLTTPLMYTGQYLDAESSLYYVRARYYDPTTAQFVTVDPAVGITLSPFAYVSGNPLNHTDPSGKAYKGCDLSTYAWCSRLPDADYYFQTNSGGVGLFSIGKTDIWDKAGHHWTEWSFSAGVSLPYTHVEGWGWLGGPGRSEPAPTYDQLDNFVSGAGANIGMNVGGGAGYVSGGPGCAAGYDFAIQLTEGMPEVSYGISLGNRDSSQDQPPTSSDWLPGVGRNNA